MARPKVFVTRRRVPDAIDLLREHFDVEIWEETTAPPKSVMLQKVTECEGILTEVDDRIDKEVLGAATILKVVANRGVGVDNFDIPEATRHGIALANTPDVVTESSADMAFALMLAVARRVAFGDRRIREGAWTVFDQVPYLGLDVHGKTLGILGLGKIGTAVARRARGFDMRVLYFTRTRKPDLEDELDAEWMPLLPDLLARSDFVSVHVSLSDETRHFIGAAELAQMKPDGILVNTSRGPTVDQRALYEALARGSIAGAGLDVFDPEPMAADDPLLSLPNVVVTPHIASASAATFREMGMLAARNIIAALHGDPMPTCVNPEVFA